MTSHEILKKYILGLNKGLANSLIVVSPAGFGKTETTMETLKELDYQEGKEFRYVANYITPVELFNLLADINHLQEPKILILDDCEDILKNQRIIGLLKSALWEANGERKVYWYSGTYKIKEKSFSFTGRIIFLLNELNKKSAVLKALVDRGLFYSFDLTLSEMIKLMEERAKLPYQNIPYNKRQEIVSFLEEVGKGSKNISLRSLVKAYNLFLLSPNHYKLLIKKTL